MIKDPTKLQQGQKLRVDLSLVRDRLPDKLFSKLTNNPVGKLVGYKMVDGNSFGLVLELEDGSSSWFFEAELLEE